MISFSAALDIITATARPLPPREASLDAALGAAAASAILSAAAVPPFANAAMDGFAVRSRDTAGASASAPVRLPVAGSLAAGAPAPAATAPATAWEIMTGAPMPAGCDAVIPLERAQVLAGTFGQADAILVREPLAAGRNRRNAAEDFGVGEPLLDAGALLSARSIMALASAGMDRVAVRPAPRIAIIATGSELAVTGAPAPLDRPASIRDANGPYLAAALAELRLPLVAGHTIPDDPDRLAAELRALAPACDIVITTGGVSAGRHDFVPATVARVGGEVLFHKVAIRPGKPLLFARLPAGPLVFGLPGNPMAVAVGLRFFVLAAVHALMGRAPERRLAARLSAPVRKREALTFFAKARARVTPDAVLTVRVLPGQESFKIGPLLRANCWAIIAEGSDEVPAGEIVPIAPLWPFDPDFASG